MHPPAISKYLVAAVTALSVAGMMACSQTTPTSPSLSAELSSDPAATSARATRTPQLNLSHVQCVDGQVEVHFVLLFVPDGTTPGASVQYNWGGGTRNAPRGKNVGNVWHYTDYLPSGSVVNITSATVQVGAQVIQLHNPGAYAGTYNCGTPGGCAFTNPYPSLYCAASPLGSPAAECAFFAPGSVPLGKDDNLTGDGPKQATRSAPVAIVKDGVAGCSPGQNSYRTYTNVAAGDLLQPPSGGNSISHITYCSCPPQ